MRCRDVDAVHPDRAHQRSPFRRKGEGACQRRVAPFFFNCRVGIVERSFFGRFRCQRLRRSPRASTVRPCRLWDRGAPAEQRGASAGPALCRHQRAAASAEAWPHAPDPHSSGRLRGSLSARWFRLVRDTRWVRRRPGNDLPLEIALPEDAVGRRRVGGPGGRGIGHRNSSAA